MVNNCQIQNWYPKFKKLSFKAKIRVLPAEFRQYLEEDGVMMPSSYHEGECKRLAINP